MSYVDIYDYVYEMNKHYGVNDKFEYHYAINKIKIKLNTTLELNNNNNNNNNIPIQIIDIGTGKGTFIKHIYKKIKHNTNLSVAVTDIKNYINVDLFNINERINFIVCDLTNINDIQKMYNSNNSNNSNNGNNNKYDFLTCINVLECIEKQYIDDTLKLFANISKSCFFAFNNCSDCQYGIELNNIQENDNWWENMLNRYYTIDDKTIINKTTYMYTCTSKII